MTKAEAFDLIKDCADEVGLPKKVMDKDEFREAFKVYGHIKTYIQSQEVQT